MKLVIDFRPGSSEFSICKVDENGNGIIVATGKLEGNVKERGERIDVLSQMVADWNDQRGH